MTASDLSDLMSVPEAAAALKVSEACIRKWLTLKKLPRIHAGRRVLVSRTSLAAILTTATPGPVGMGPKLVA